MARRVSSDPFMQRIASLLKVRPEEGGMALLVGLLFLCVQAGQGMGDNTASALFFLRFGVDFLPYMYVLLGAVTFALTLGYAAGLGRIQRNRFYGMLTAGMAAALLIERMALLRPVPILYPILWLTVSCIGMLVGTFSWNLAGDVSDARQAKRLFPLFTSAGILGSVLGNSLTGPLAKTLGTENLLLFQAALLGGAFLLTRRIGRRYLLVEKPKGKRAGLLDDVRAGYDFVRGSSLMKLMAYAAVLFSIMFFSIAYPFSKVVAASFPNEASVAGFLGLFTSITTAITFLVSLLVANRIYTRLGIVNSVLILPLVYGIGFAVFAASYSLTGGVVARFMQLVVLSGLAGSAYNALFNVVPAQKRGQVLAFENGVPSQIGVALSGALLVLGDRLPNTSEILLLGLVVTAGCGYLVWRMRGAYGEALVQALRAGRLEVFSSEQAGFAGLQGDTGALNAAIEALGDAKPATRRLGAEILGKMGNAQAGPALRKCLGDADSAVRAAALTALGKLRDSGAGEGIVRALDDADANVRLSALRAIAQLDAGIGTQIVPRLERMLSDESLEVRKESLVTLAGLSEASSWRRKLDELLSADAPELRSTGLEAFGRIAACCAGDLDPGPVLGALQDPSMAIRIAACRGLASMRDERTTEALVNALHDPQAAVRGEAAAALKERGPAAHEAILKVMENGDERACEAALDALTAGQEPTTMRLRAYARAEIERLRKLRNLIASLPASDRATMFLRESLEQRFGRGEERLVKVVGLIGQGNAMDWVRKHVRGSDPQTRAAALEALETLGDKALAREIIVLLEQEPAPLSAGAALEMIMGDEDRWPRALAVRAAVELGLSGLRSQIGKLTSDPDELVRDAASEALSRMQEATPMATLKTISTLERVLLLREVPIFSELSPEDLQRVAEMAQEEWYPTGTPLCHQGEVGENMFIIADGHVRVVQAAEGGERLLAERGRGDFVGEMSIIDSERRSATLLTEGEVRALIIDGETFKGILRERPEVSLAVLRSFSRRLRDVSA